MLKTNLLKGLIIAGAIFVGTSQVQVHASTLTFDFSFTNAAANGGGTVDGVIYGLQDNSIGAATSVQVTSNTLGFGIGEYLGDPSQNFFEVSDGTMTLAFFNSFGDFNTSPAVTCCSLGLNYDSSVNSTNAGLTDLPGALDFNEDTSALTFTPVSPTPLPAALPLFATVLSLGALLGLRMKRKGNTVMATA
jgi:hypothetical protein